MFVADELRSPLLNGGMLDSKGLIAELHRLRDENITTNADLARLLDLPTSRIAEIFSGKRAVKIDEMKAIVDHFGLERSPAALSAEALEPLLDALVPLVPPSGRLTEQSRRALAQALAYGLELLGAHPTTRPSDDAAAVASRGAVSRFRDLLH